MRITLFLAFLFIFVTNLSAQQADLTAFDWGVMPSASAAAPDMSLRPRFVTDGKPDTGWVAPADYQPLWLRLEWRFPVTVHQLTLRQFPQSKSPDMGRLGKLSLEADVQGKWQLLQTLDASATDPAQEIKFVLPEPVRTTAIRFVIQSATGKTIGVSEVKAFGVQPVLPMSYAPAWKGAWIWCEPSLRLPHREPVTRYFRRSFDLPDAKQVREAWLIGTAYDRATMYLNANEAWREPTLAGGLMRRANIKQIPLEWLQNGENVLSAKVQDVYEVGSQGLLAELILINQDG
ncbi:MAG: discoidin domain-containing protein, partial [Bacteroidota bacterium]